MATPLELTPKDKWLEDLLDELRDELVSYAASRGCGRESEDIVQTVYTETWENRHTIDPDRNPRALLYAKVRRAVAKQKHNRCIPTDDPTVLCPGPDGEAADVTLIPRQFLRDASDTLSDDARLALTLRYVYGAPLKHIAARLKLTESGVSWKLRRAKKKLKEDLQRRGLLGIPVAAGFTSLIAWLKRTSDAGTATANASTGTVATTTGATTSAAAVGGGGATAGTAAAGASATTICVSVAAGAGTLAIVIGIVTGVLGGDAPEANAGSPPPPATESVRAPAATTRSADANDNDSSRDSSNRSSSFEGAGVPALDSPRDSLNPASSDPGGSGDRPPVRRSLKARPDGPNGPEQSHSLQIDTPAGTIVVEGEYERTGPILDPVCQTAYPDPCEG